MHPPPLLLLLLSLCLPAAAADHYRTLGVSRDATAAAIKAAYREAALALHPDRTRGLGAEEQRRSERLFEQVNEAFQVLGDEERRAAYDRAEAAAAAAAAAARRGEGGEAARRGAARVEAAVRCTLEQLGGWEDAPVALEVWRRVTRARLTRAEAARAGLPARLRVAAGSVAGETVRVHVPALGPAGVEVDFVLVEEAHRMWRRRGDDLWARLTLPAWHDLLRPAVRLRAIDGGTVTVWPRGRRVGRRALVRIPSRGMPRRAAAGGEALFGMPRGEMVVELVLRSVRREALLTAARAAGATCALVCARPVGRLASAWLPARLRDAAEWSLAAVGVAHDFLSVELLGRATPAARRARENARRARRAHMAARELAEKRKRRDRWLGQMLHRGRGAANSVREWQRAWWAWAFDKL